MMRIIFSTFLVLCFCAQLSAQIENTKKPLKIKSAESKPLLKNSTTLKIPGVTNPSDFKILNKKNSNAPLNPLAGFVNPNKPYDGKFKKEEDRKIDPKFRKDQFLGDFKTNSKAVNFICRDHEYVDGDRVRVLVNDVVVKANILLEGKFKGFSVELKSGFNKIDIQALNQGSSGPNTAEFRIYDDNGGLISSNEWNLATGVKATVVVVKE